MRQLRYSETVELQPHGSSEAVDLRPLGLPLVVESSGERSKASFDNLLIDFASELLKLLDFCVSVKYITSVNALNHLLREGFSEGPRTGLVSFELCHECIGKRENRKR